jgi:hypothetical protein
LLYLRARYYNPADGRFQSRDTWSGDVNRPLSLNRWMYVEGNPVNYMDPTGLHPGESHFKYCNLLTEKDYQYCNNIVRGIHPDTQMSWAQYFLYDFFDEGCDILNLHKSLPHSLYMGTWKEYGWWWHYLLDRTPGWWNDNGKGHIYFKEVLTFALAAELSTAVVREPDMVGYAAGAMANKGRSDGSFYKMIGSRQSVFFRINTALYGANSPEPGTPYNFAGFGHKFGAEINNVAGNVLKIQEWGNNILSNTGFTPEQKLAYEFGNVTDYTKNNFPKLMAALRRPDTGTSIDQVLWYSDDRIAFIVSQAQLRNLCGGGSCVYKDLGK